MIYLFNMIIISLFCAGLSKASEPNMLLGGLAMWWDRKTQNKDLSQSWIYTVTMGCVYCYASFWGTVLYWVLQTQLWEVEIYSGVWIMWPITCVCCVFLNGLFYQILTKYEIANKTIPQA